MQFVYGEKEVRGKEIEQGKEMKWIGTHSGSTVLWDYRVDEAVILRE